MVRNSGEHRIAAGETSWEKPHVTDWIKLKDPDGMSFYFNTKTKQSEWEAPVELAWKEVHSDEHKAQYWYNEITQASQWTAPELFAWTHVPGKEEL